MAEIWFPQQVRTLLRLDDMEIINFLVIPLDKTFARDDLIDSQHIGLTLIKGSELIVSLTSMKRIYLFGFRDEQHVKFLKKLFKKDDLIFHVYDGAKIGYLFDRYLNIRLSDYPNMFDLISLDYQIRLDMTRKESDNVHTGNFTSERIAANGRPRQFNLEEMISKWFGTDLPNFEPQIEEREAIKILPYNTEAENYIRKEAALLRALGMELYESYEKMIDKKSEALLSFGIRASDDTRESYLRDNDNSFAHLCRYLSSCPNVDY